jgi:hypothetical protein
MINFKFNEVTEDELLDHMNRKTDWWVIAKEMKHRLDSGNTKPFMISLDIVYKTEGSAKTNLKKSLERVGVDTSKMEFSTELNDKGTKIWVKVV